MAFREDESRVRTDNAPHNLALARHIALNLLKQEMTLSLPARAFDTEGFRLHNAGVVR